MLKRFIKKEIHNLYLNNLLRGIAFSLFGIFVPIYFLSLGYTLQSIFIYFLIFAISTFLFILIGYSLAKKFGYKTLIIASTPIVILYLILLQFLPTIEIPIYIISIIAGIANGFYFLPVHGFFTNLSEDNRRGTQYSHYNIAGQLSGLFGPIGGALITMFFGFGYLFLTAILVITISLIPLFYLEKIFPKEKITLKKVKKLSINHKGFFLGTIANGIKGEIEGIVWPIFVFLTLKDLLSIGGIGFLITIGSIIFTLFLGKHYDQKSKYFFMKIGGVLYFLLWVLRAFIESQIFIFASSFFAGFFSLMIGISFDTIFYEKAIKEKNSNTFIVFREIPLVIGRIALWTSIIIFSISFGVNFILAGIAGLFFTFLKFGIKEDTK